MASVIVLTVTWDQTQKTAKILKAFIALMCFTSAARIFKMVYDRRWPLVTVTEFGTELIRPVNTIAGQTAMFFHKNIDLISFLSAGLLMLLMDKHTSESAEKEIPLLFWTGMAWSMMYFLYFLAPIFFILSLIACLPCIIIILQRFFNFSLVNPNETSRAAPATQALLDKVWKVGFTANDSFEYTNPELPDQKVVIQKEDTKCSICLGWYEEGDDLRILPCSHHFHLGCADEWFKITATCPLCVRPIRPNSQEPSSPTATNSNSPDSNV